MSITRVNFDQISEADLQDLIETGVPEGILVDYKLGPYGRADADVKEFLKDSSSFANTSGGHLIIGMDEAEGVPTRIVPLVGLDADKEIQRLESLLRDGITPRIAGTRIKAVPVSDGGVVLVLRIPRSWNPPHQVSARNTNRFYVRNSAGAHEMSIDELRASFNLGANSQDRARTFRTERLRLIASGRGPAVLANPDGKLVLHIVPLAAFSGPASIDLQRAYGMGLQLQPMGSMGMTPHYNFDGLLNVMMGDAGQIGGYTQLFRDGRIEAVTVRAIVDYPENGGRFIPVKTVTSRVMRALPGYVDALRDLEVSPPFAVMLSITETRGAKIGVDDREIRPPIQHDVLELPEVLIEDFATANTYQRATKPAFDALWNAGGYARSQDFNDKGDWTGQ